MPTFYADFDLTTGLNDGSSPANAYQTFQDVLNAIVATTIVGGDEVKMTGTDNPSTSPNINYIASYTSRILLKGYASDFTSDGHFVIDATSCNYCLEATSSGLANLDIERGTFQNSISDLLHRTGTNFYDINFTDCNFINSGANVCWFLSYANFNNCYISGTTSSDFAGGESINLTNCYLTSGNFVFNANDYSVLENCIVHDYSYVNTGTSRCSILNSIVDTMSSDVINISEFSCEVINSRVTNCTAIAVNVASSPYGSIVKNTFFYNPSGTDLGGASSSGLFFDNKTRLTGVNSSAGYADIVTHDFTLTSGEDGVAVANPIGLLSETTNVGYLTQGVNPTASGGAGLFLTTARYHNV